MKVNAFYLGSIIMLMFLLPIFSIILEFYYFHSTIHILFLIGKWYLFWGMGLRLFTAGLKQIFQPAFTASSIFQMTDTSAYVIIRELGIANVCIGLSGILSLFIPSWRMPCAFLGSMFFGLAGLLHILRNPRWNNEKIPLYSNLLASIILVVFFIFLITN